MYVVMCVCSATAEAVATATDAAIIPLCHLLLAAALIMRHVCPPAKSACVRITWLAHCAQRCVYVMRRIKRIFMHALGQRI